MKEHREAISGRPAFVLVLLCCSSWDGGGGGCADRPPAVADGKGLLGKIVKRITAPLIGL